MGLGHRENASRRLGMPNRKLDGLGECHSSLFQFLQGTCRFMELARGKLEGDLTGFLLEVDNRARRRLLILRIAENPFSGFLKFAKIFENDRATREPFPQTHPPVFFPASAGRLAHSYSRGQIFDFRLHDEIYTPIRRQVSILE